MLRFNVAQERSLIMRNRKEAAEALIADAINTMERATRELARLQEEVEYLNGSRDEWRERCMIAQANENRLRNLLGQLRAKSQYELSKDQWNVLLDEALQ